MYLSFAGQCVRMLLISVEGLRSRGPLNRFTENESGWPRKKYLSYLKGPEVSLPCSVCGST